MTCGILALLLGMAWLLGVAMGFSAGRDEWRHEEKEALRLERERFSCPWSSCNYPLSRSPLYTLPADAVEKVPWLSTETCDGCGNKVAWHTEQKRYVRWRAP